MTTTRIAVGTIHTHGGIETEYREMDSRSTLGWEARVVGQPGYWEIRASEAEAIGALVRRLVIEGWEITAHAPQVEVNA